MKKLKRILILLAVLLAILGFLNYPKLNIISGYASKNWASNQFIAKRDYTSVTENDHDMPLIKLADLEQAKGNAVTASVYGLMPRETVCYDGLGCVLINTGFDKNQKRLAPNRTFTPSSLPFPYGNRGKKDTVFDNLDYDRINDAIDFAFSNPDIQRTRTVLIAYKNHIVAERYGEGFTPDTPILGWSMTKSVLATLYGILESQGHLVINEYRPFDNDSQIGGRKADITLDHLLRMQSGLAWEEDYTSISDVTEMLFMDADMTQKQADQAIIAAPTEVWNYSSGTSNLLSGILRKQFGTHQQYLDFPYSALIDKIGMHSMLIETDMAGNFVGSSYAWASTRDWAKLGILHLNKGNWNGEQIFDPTWIDYITTPTQGSNGTYGAHWWLNSQGKYAKVPHDLYSANGFQGQFVFVIPSKELVIVRTGLAEAPDFEVNEFLARIVSAIP